MDKFERNSGLFCPHSPLCALKSIPPPAARSPTVAPRGQPARSWRGLWRGGEWPWRRAAIARARLQPVHGQAAKAYLLARETYGFAARNHTSCHAPSAPSALPCAARRALATHHTTAESSPAPDETGQNGLPSPLRHTPTWRGSAGDSALSALAMRPRLIIKAAAGHASRPSARDLGGGAEERWNGRFLAKSALPSPHSRGRGSAAQVAGGGGIGHWLAAVRPRPLRQASFRTKGTTTRNDRAGKPQAYGRDGLAGGERNAPAGRAS